MQYITPPYHLGMPYIVIAFVCLYLSISSPSSSPVDSETADEPGIDYTIEDSFSPAELSGKQTLLEHAYITYSFSLLLALEFATAFV